MNLNRTTRIFIRPKADLLFIKNPEIFLKEIQLLLIGQKRNIILKAVIKQTHYRIFSRCPSDHCMILTENRKPSAETNKLITESCIVFFKWIEKSEVLTGDRSHHEGAGTGNL